MWGKKICSSNIAMCICALKLLRGPFSPQSDASSVRILRPSAKVSPEPVIPTPESEPERLPRCVFGVALETLREDGQMLCGIPLVLRDMVKFLDKNGKLDC